MDGPGTVVALSWMVLALSWGGRDGRGTVVGPSGDGCGIIGTLSWLSRRVVLLESCDLTKQTA